MSVPPANASEEDVLSIVDVFSLILSSLTSCYYIQLIPFKFQLLTNGYNNGKKRIIVGPLVFPYVNNTSQNNILYLQ